MRLKKFIATFWVIALSTGIVSTYHVAEAKAQIHGDTFLSISSIASQLTTPEAVAKYMWRHFLFEHDRSLFGKDEYWQTPDEFAKNQKGDCEDFALFAKEMLRQNGITAFLLNIYGSRFSHTICVFLENGKYNAIDGTDIKRYEADSLEELMTRIYPHWKSGAIVAMSMKTNKGRVLKKITR